MRWFAYVGFFAAVSLFYNAALDESHAGWLRSLMVVGSVALLVVSLFMLLGSGIRCRSCGQRGKTHKPESGKFELRGRYGNKAIVKCNRCGNGMLVGFLKRVKPIPPGKWEDLQAQWAAYTSPEARTERDAAREARRRTYQETLVIPTATDASERNPYQEALDQEHGIRIPAWWYLWPDGLDEETMDMSRVVFLPENMPPELLDKSPAELSEMGVMQVPGEEAMDMLIQDHVDETGVPMSPEEQKAFARDYIARFTLREE